MAFDEVKGKMDVSIEGLQNIVTRLKDLEQQQADVETMVIGSTEEASKIIKEAHEILDRLENAFKFSKGKTYSGAGDAFSDYINTQKEISLKNNCVDIPKEVRQSYPTMINKIKAAGFKKTGKKGIWRR